MVKVMLHRVNVNLFDRKILTAEKILDNVEALMSYLEEGKVLHIITDPELRMHADVIPLSYLKKRFLMSKGQLYMALNKDIDAQDYFLDAISEPGLFEARLYIHLLNLLMKLQLKQNKTDTVDVI